MGQSELQNALRSGKWMNRWEIMEATGMTYAATCNAVIAMKHHEELDCKKMKRKDRLGHYHTIEYVRLREKRRVKNGN